VSVADSVTYCERHKTPLQPRLRSTETVSPSSVGLTGGLTGGWKDPYCPACEFDLTHLYRLLYGDIGFCGCGDPGSAYDTIGMILALIDLKWKDPEKTDHAHWKACSELIQQQAGTSGGAFNLVMYILDRAGLLEHGSSVRGAWLTKRGKHCLHLMNAYSFDEVEGAGYYPHGGDPCGPGCRDWEASYEDWQKKERKS
jgi:hypothetical protein